MSVDLAKLDRILYFLNKKIRFSLLNPINLKQAKEHVLKDITYNPQFTYHQPEHNLHALRKELNGLQFDDSLLGKLLHLKRNELLKTVLLLQSIATPKFTSASLNLYGRPSQELVHKAQKLIKLDATHDPQHYGGITTVKKFMHALTNEGLPWKVKEKEMVVSAGFDIHDRTLLINSKKRFSDNDLKRLVVHEIGTHIRRAENSKKRKHKLFLIGFPNYLMTEEGLAVYAEEQAGVLTNNILKTYAARVVAVDLALKSSFSSVCTALREYFSPDEAFTLTIRAKRGMADTSKPGGFTKDYYYLQGYDNIKKYVRKGGKIDPLFAGKIGIEHVPYLKYLE